MKEKFKHCDDYIHDFSAPKCLRFFLLWSRMPAADQMLMREFREIPVLYADYQNVRVRVVAASRLGDVGISRKLDQEDGYETRVPVEELTNFGVTP